MCLPAMRKKIKQENEKGEIQRGLERDIEWWNEPDLIPGTYAFDPSGNLNYLHELRVHVETLEKNLETCSLSLKHTEEKLETEEGKIEKLYTEKAELQSELSCMRERLGQLVGELVRISYDDIRSTR
ncbi:hypothetical protein D9758_017130 [Tetrapyrgos nigripes]|uniref:Uncharacterized protein n=1 Tax=Tetrapyrgos nigripes TaxID=182062 RepID=A0A8H5F553_9AGAR|nr:hypothetical protein D9758_017130 [Tetrapyrgos nigripes]